MNRSPKIWLILLLVAAGASAWALQRLFILRFAAGDIYPAYSSLRADPLGTKALYDSLDALTSVEVQRNHESLAKLRDPRQTTLLVCGVPAVELSSLALVEVKELEAVAASGGRLVIGLSPASRKPPPRWIDDEDEPEDKKKEPPPRCKDGKCERLRSTSLAKEWGFELVYADAPAGPTKGRAKRLADGSLPETVAWHSVTWFDKVDHTWLVVYAVDKRPVIIERRMGGGTIVLCADSYIFSNEALLKDREPALLAWLVGASHRVLFDEAHFGIEHHPGVITLARRYRLHGLMLGLVLLAGLFVWQNTARLVPPAPEELVVPANLAEGRDSAAALTNLLRRGVARDQLLRACVREWKQSLAHGRADLTEKLTTIKSLAERPASPAEIVAAYHELRSLLEKKRL